MTVEKIAPLVSRLGALPFFPPAVDVDARIAVAMVMHQCAGDNLDRIEWAVNRCLALWDKWEGPHELRAMICSKFPPADGIEAHSRLPQFAEGIPSEDESRNQALLGGAGEVKRLPAGPALDLLRTLTPAPRPRDKVDEISEYTEQLRKLKNAAIPDQSEIERIKAEQERNRRES